MQRGIALQVLVVLERARDARERPRASTRRHVEGSHHGVERGIDRVDARLSRLSELLRRHVATLQPVQEIHDVVASERIVGARVY